MEQDTTNWVPMVSFGAFADPGMGHAKAELCINKNNNVEPEVVRYENLIPTSLDSAGGSSGGGVLVDAQTASGHYMLAATAVMSSVKPFSGHGWDYHVDSETPDQDNAVYVTGATDEVRDWADRDSPGDGWGPWEPWPIQADELNPEVRGSDANKKPIYSELQPNKIWGIPPDIDPFDGDEGQPGEQPVWRMVCNGMVTPMDHWMPENTAQNWTLKTGLVTGFLGGPSISKLDSKVTTVGTLKMICAPWSYVSWTENWQFLYQTGRNLGGGPTWTQTGNASSLRYGLTHFREKRFNADGVEVNRPASFKMCPPNYYLKGVGVEFRNNGENEPVLTGIRTLKCQTGLKNPDLAPIVFTNTAPSLGQTALYDDYIFRDMPFSIDQRLGYPWNPEADDYAMVECQDNHGSIPQVVSGMAISSTQYVGHAGAPISRFWLECGDLPVQP